MPSKNLIRQSDKPSNLISWSKNGFIAYVPSTSNISNATTSKENLLLTYLENIDGKSWQLAKPQLISIKLENNFLPELTLVSWSSLSTDLAISDVYGNFYVLLAGVGLLEQKENRSTPSGTASTSTTTISENGIDRRTPANDNSPSYELTSYNHMEMIYRDIINQGAKFPINKRASIISFKWLTIEKPQILNKPATLMDLGPSNITTNTSMNGRPPNPQFAYNYTVSQYTSHGVSHPIPTKQACVALRQNGQFMLYFQGEHKVEYHKISLFLNETLSIITHASIGFTNDKQIIITTLDSMTNKITSYSVIIDWGFLVESAKRQKLDPHYHTPKEAQKAPRLILLKIQEMKPIPLFVDNKEVANGNENANGDSMMDIDGEGNNNTERKLISYQLGKIASIDVISANADKDSKLSILISYIFRNDEEVVNTVIYKYNLVEKLDFVSDAFIDLGIRKNVSTGNSNKRAQALVLTGKITLPGEIQSITTGLADFYIMAFFKNGDITVIDATTWKVVNNSASSPTTTSPPQTISTIFDVGFSFPKINPTHPFTLAVSPNMTSIAYIEFYENNINLSFKAVEKTRNLGLQSRELFAISAGFAYRHAYACYTNTCSDDLLILIQKELIRIKTQLLEHMGKAKQEAIDGILGNFIESIIGEAHKAINFQLDGFSKENIDKLLSNPPLQKLLSLQLSLGESHQNSVNSRVMSDIAWIVLNLRSSSVGIMFSLSSIYRQISKKKPAEDSLQDSITRGECIISLIGNVKWLIDLMAYLNQELLQLSLYKDNTNPSSKLTKKNSIVLPIILSKVPRLFLMYAVSSIGKTHEILKQLHKDLSEANKLFNPMKESLNRYFTICNNAPLTLSLFETYLRECDALITKELSTRLLGKEKGYALKLEQKLFIKGEIVAEMEEISQMVIDRYAANIGRELKVSELFFYKTDWLDIGINRKQQAIVNNTDVIMEDGHKIVVPRLRLSSKRECIDALRKVMIGLDGQNTKKSSTGGGSGSSTATTTTSRLSQKNLRKCTRCRAVSLVSDPLVFETPTTLGLWTMVFQRTCICGNTWVNVDV